jgi:hypothetical protein
MRRREFLARSVSVGAAGALVPAVAFATVAPIVPVAPVAELPAVPASPQAGSPAPRFSKAWFEALLGQDVVFHREGGAPVPGRLVAVSALPGSPRHQQFSVVFQVTGADAQGGLVETHHATAGRFPLFMSPCADGGTRLSWQAHFSLTT